MILLNCIFEGSNLQKWEKGKKTSTVMSLKITGDITKKARFYRTFLWLYLFCTTIMEGVDTLDAALDAGFVAEMKEKIRMHVAVRLNLVPSGNEKDTRRFLN